MADPFPHTLASLNAAKTQPVADMLGRDPELMAWFVGLTEVEQYGVVRGADWAPLPPSPLP